MLIALVGQSRVSGGINAEEEIPRNGKKGRDGLGCEKKKSVSTDTRM